MSEPQRQHMTPEEFFEWQTHQDRNYELVNGIPILPLKAMTGATLRHDTVTVNALIALGNQLRGGPCRPRTDDAAIRISVSRIRRPDLIIDCGAMRDSAMEAQEPRLVLEVLSPSTMSLDRFQKLDEYKTHPSIQLILLAETRRAKVGLWRRQEADWAVEEYEGLQATIELPEIRASLPLAELYEGLSFEP
jgi:Uma2 family endonuclease